MFKCSQHIYLSKNQLLVDFQKQLEFEKSLNYAKVFKGIYKDLGLDYPKYFKMDYLSKLGFLSAEVILKDQPLTSKYASEKIGLIIGNASSTYLMDSKHQSTLSDKTSYFPSPANFVYTLPNIMTGEICIRHGFKGENALFISQKMDIDFLWNYAYNLFENHKLDACLLGYVEVKDDDYESFLMLLERTEKQGFTQNNLKNICTTYKKETNG
ncbi:MAG: hypothetical protein JW729_10620 [Bacteroidales bacterium]|nr:hypothetical protein [Bacteroidales bacterium]